MHEVVESKRHQIQALCRKLSVLRLDVFGSAVSDSFDVTASDVDVLVEFEAGPDFDQYFALKEGLEEIIGRAVDVVTASGLGNLLQTARHADARTDLCSLILASTYGNALQAAGFLRSLLPGKRSGISG